jgi:chemotaxis protein MotB
MVSLENERRRGPYGFGPIVGLFSAMVTGVDRANVVRRILEEQGFPSANFYQVAGKADTDPLFPDDPFMAANRRVTITLMREAPPVPSDLKP